MAVASVLRKMFPYTGIALIGAMLYAGWTIRSRLSQTQQMEQATEAKKIEANKKVLDMVGNDLRIITFYSSPVIHPGQKTLICYGVANAKSVTITPEIEPLTPSLSRCIDVAPPKTTEYTLTAEDAAGHKVSQTLAIKVQ